MKMTLQNAINRGYNLLGTPSEKAVAEGFARLAGEKRASR